MSSERSTTTSPRSPANISPEPPAHDPRRLIVFGVVVTIAALLLVWIAYNVLNVLLMVYISGLFAMGISPLVQMIERQRIVEGGRIPRWLAILVIYGAIVGALAAILSIVIPPIVDQADDLWRALPGKLKQGQDFLMRVGVLRNPITLGEAVQQGAPASGSAISTIFSTVRGVFGGVFGVITVLLLTFYMLVESHDILAFFLRLFPPHRRDKVAAISLTVTNKVSAWLGGQLLLSLIIGLTSALGLWLMGVPYFYVLALISAVGEMIPMVGPILAAIPAILVAVTVSPQLAFFVAVFFIVQQQLENTILVPKIMGRQVGLSAVTVIVALGIGGSLLGVVGAILAVPTAAIIQVLFDELLARDE